MSVIVEGMRNAQRTVLYKFRNDEYTAVWFRCSTQAEVEHDVRVPTFSEQGERA